MGTRSGLTEIRRVLGQRWVRVLGTIVVLAISVAVAVSSVETGRVFEAIRLADPAILAVAGCAYAVSWPLRGRRYDDILAVMDGRCGTWFSTAAVFVSQMVNLAVPARAGDGFRAYLLKRRRAIPYTTGVASLTVERLFDLLALAVFGSVAGLFLAVGGRSLTADRAGTFLTAAAGVAAVSLMLVVLTVGLSWGHWNLADRLRRRLGSSRIAWLVNWLIRFGADLRDVAANPRALLRVGVGSLAVWALDVATAVLVLTAVVGTAGSSPLLIATGTLAVTVGNLAKVLPLSQGGIGLYEAAFTAVVVAASPITAATALAAAILDHAVKNGVTVLGGVSSIVILNVSPGAITRERPEPESSDF